MASRKLEDKTTKYSLKLQKTGGPYPAVVVGAEYGRVWKIDRSRACYSNIHRILYKQLMTQGNLYQVINGNPLGCCAEVNASDKLLKRLNHHIELNTIQFSNPRRPRTNQIVPICDNCKITFE